MRSGVAKAKALLPHFINAIVRQYHCFNSKQPNKEILNRYLFVDGDSLKTPVDLIYSFPTTDYVYLYINICSFQKILKNENFILIS